MGIIVGFALYFQRIKDTNLTLDSHFFLLLFLRRTHVKQYYLSSLPAEAVENTGAYIRGHWRIENRLHWHLDVTFREDHCRARKAYAAQNLNTIRKLALAIVSQKKDKQSIRKRLFTAALNVDYLKELLKI